MRLRYRKRHTHSDGLGWGWGGNKDGTALKLKKEGHSRLLSKPFYAFGYQIGNCCPRIMWNMISPCAEVFRLGRGREGGGGGAGK